MKRILSLFLTLPFIALSQNNPPEISNLQAMANLANQTIAVTFDLSDPDGDMMTLNVYVSADDGKSHVAHVVSATGDIGANIASGTGKSVTITYNNDSLLTSAQGNVLAQFTVKVVATDGHAVPMQEIISQVDSLSVYNDMLWIAQPRNYVSAPTGITTVKDSIETRFTSYDLQTERLLFSWAGHASENMVGRHPGVGNERNTIIIDGHFDAVNGSPGADDNGTAVAAVMAASRILSQYQFNHTLKFIGFDKEENGLQGSLNYINNQIPHYEDISAVLNSEMIGYYSEDTNSQTVPFGFDLLFPATVDSIVASGYQGKWLFVVGNAASASLISTFNTVARANIPNANTLMLNVPGNGQIAPDLRRSDHAPFWDAGFQALMLTDGAEFRNANYHTPGDSLGNLNIPFLVRNIQAVIATAAHLAEPVYADSKVAPVGQLIANVPFSLTEIPEMRVEVFPNPSTHVLYFRFNQPIGAAKIAIHDLQGRTELHEEIDLEGNSTHSVDLHDHHLKAGIYVLSIRTENMEITRRFVVSEGHTH